MIFVEFAKVKFERLDAGGEYWMATDIEETFEVRTISEEVKGRGDKIRCTEGAE